MKFCDVTVIIRQYFLEQDVDVKVLFLKTHDRNLNIIIFSFKQIVPVT